ncbi:protein kinase [Tumidithrix elongata RA019]|uniref:Protein kinase n=1 Tax=Tumidithrix elongata BACA0141 TaxID=2716417 RepID=A0AAW9Q2V8_9CYAN|nr:protein kinase [Tumidithrix elongata RA019]
MSDLPDFSLYGYQIHRELAPNYLNGLTYLATDIHRQETVAIATYPFPEDPAIAQSRFPQIERGVELLQGLEHRGIPKYHGIFFTESSYGVVQAYQEAETLASLSDFPLEGVKQIAIQVLEILSYLESHYPPIVHQNIRSEHILIDFSFNHVYLIGFEAILFRDRSDSMQLVAERYSFWAPEQWRDRELTAATDLYGLGVTLICLLTGTQSANVRDLYEHGAVVFADRIPHINLGLREWLEKLVKPNSKYRYPDAKTAIAELETIGLNRLPEVRLSHQQLHYLATEIDETSVQTMTVTNPIPEALLEGSWSVIPHPYDLYAWITIEPSRFSGNCINCNVILQTNRLMANSLFQRQIVLNSNAAETAVLVPISLRTAPFIPSAPTLPYGAIAIFLLCCLTIPGVWGLSKTWLWLLLGIGLGAVTVNLAKRCDWNITVSAIGGGLLGSWVIAGAWSWVVMRFWQIATVYSGYLEEHGQTVQDSYGGFAGVWGILIGVAIWVGFLTGSAATVMVGACFQKRLLRSFILQLLGTASLLTLSLAITAKSETANLFVSLISIGSLAGLVFTIYRPIQKFRQQMSAYKKRAKSLIKS